jgi:HrpA-like RNA helicase
MSQAAEILGEYQQTVDPDEVDLDLALKVIEHIHASEESATADGSAGAILVFLPGWDEIAKLRDMLREHRTLGRKGEAHIYPLHSMVAPSEQRRVFSRPPQGVRKVVLATNIAETAVTIDDVVYVVDSGRLKEKSFDPYTGVSTLQTTWVSKAGAQQRRGRAGRCQPGKVFRLFSKARHEAMADFQLPELKRSPLEELCLQVKLLEGVPGLMGAHTCLFLQHSAIAFA